MQSPRFSSVRCFALCCSYFGFGFCLCFCSPATLFLFQLFLRLQYMFLFFFFFFFFLLLVFLCLFLLLFMFLLLSFARVFVFGFGMMFLKNTKIVVRSWHSFWSDEELCFGISECRPRHFSFSFLSLSQEENARLQEEQRTRQKEVCC